MIRFLLALIVSVLISFLAHKVIAIQELYFVFGALDAFIVMLIFYDQ